MMNYESFVLIFGFAVVKMPALSWTSLYDSSGKYLPYMDPPNILTIINLKIHPIIL
mgnify:CR=1 FL=1